MKDRTLEEKFEYFWNVDPGDNTDWKDGSEHSHIISFQAGYQLRERELTVTVVPQDPSQPIVIGDRETKRLLDEAVDIVTKFSEDVDFMLESNSAEKAENETMYLNFDVWQQYYLNGKRACDFLKKIGEKQ